MAGAASATAKSALFRLRQGSRVAVAACALRAIWLGASGRLARSDGQALAALGASGSNHGAAATGFHAHEKAVGAGASGLRGLVGAFHGGGWAVSEQESGKPVITAKKAFPVNDLPLKGWTSCDLDENATTVDNRFQSARYGLQFD